MPASPVPRITSGAGGERKAHSETPTTPALLVHRAAYCGELTALVHDDAKASYAELDERSRSIAGTSPDVDSVTRRRDRP